MQIDILAFGVHPDDIELGCGGTLITHSEMGYSIGLVDLTKGELGTRGTPQIRLKEAENASKLLGASFRENLGMADGFFKNDKDHQLEIIKIIRKYQPKIVFANAKSDRHPDHGRAGDLLRDACFYAGLKRIETKVNGANQAAYRPPVLYHYIQAYYHKPDFVVDISQAMDKKMQAILAHQSQFYNPDSNEPNTFISSPEFLEFVKARQADWGKIINVKYAEGFNVNRHIGVTDVTKLI